MNGNGALDERNLKWLRKRMDLACDMAEPVETLRKSGFSDAAILEAIEKVRPRGNALANGAPLPPLIRRQPPNLHKIDNPHFDAYTLDGFLNAGECAKLIALIGHHLRPSTVGHGYSSDTFRTSQTADLCHLRSPVALAIDAKICKTLGIRAEYSEGISAQRYDVGQQFKAHWDFFRPDTDLYRRGAGLRGNRTWTFMVYLNDGMEGGATRFTKIDHAVAPKAGKALLWNNLNADGSPNEHTMHAGEPVTAGHKIIITKWFRVHGDGPVFHD
jgi:prolyl 4-hydroxylase